MKQVKTGRGLRWVEKVAYDARLWDLYKSQDKPVYLSVNKYLGEWQFVVWADTEDECRGNIHDLNGRLSKLPIKGDEGRRGRKKTNVPSGRLSEEDKCEVCDGNK